MDSDFYLIGTSAPKFTNDIPKDLALKLLNEANVQLSSKVIIAPLSIKTKEFLEKSSTENYSNCAFIYLKTKTEVNLNDWFEILNTYKASSIVELHKLDNSHLTKAIHSLRKKEQDQALQQMLTENKSDLNKEKIAKIEELSLQEQKLKRNKKRAKQIHLNEKLNLTCLEAIFNSKSIGEIEEHITEILREAFKIDWVRILISPSDILAELPTIKFQNQFEVKIFELDFDTKAQGKMAFASKKGAKIKESANSLLQKICDALSLRLKQIATETDIENSKRQWEITFKALPFKAALINKNYKVLEIGGRLNTPETEANKSELCHEKFFGRKTPCNGCKLGESFLIDQKNESLEVNSKEVFDPISDEHYYLNFYRDFEVSTLGESGKATKTKLEELGIVSGSIAHELNNPLGGIKILLELLKEEPDLKSPDVQEDLNVLMQSTNKCVNIVNELLNFTRASKDPNSKETKTLLDYFEQLKVFTQAYLLSEGVVLKIVEGDYLQQKIVSSDSTLSIKLLEAVAHISKRVHKSRPGINQTIYLYGQAQDSGSFEISLAANPPKHSPEALSAELPIDIGLLKKSFEEVTAGDQTQMLTLKFSTEVKLKGTQG